MDYGIMMERFRQEFEVLCKRKGVKFNEFMCEFWHSRLKNYKHEAIVDVFDAMASGVKGFPTLDEVSAWLHASKKHEPVRALKKDDGDIRLTQQDIDYGRRMAPLFFDWVRGRVTTHRYFQEMKMHSDDCGVRVDWEEMAASGMSIPWIADSRYEGDENERCGQLRMVKNG